jgi:O-antigen/teichoic acid export membrane protein
MSHPFTRQAPSPHDPQGIAAPPSTGRLLTFTGWNLVGLCAPMAVAFFALPVLRSTLGPDLYGAFIFLLTVINYLTILDLGLGRATTRFMAMRLARGRLDELAPVFWTALGLMGGFGLVGMALFMPLIEPLVCRWSRIPAALQPDAVRALFAAGLCTPFLVLTAALVGVLEAHQKFRRINLIRLPMQVYTFLGPLALALVSPTLTAPVVALVAGKGVECALYFTTCLRVAPELRRGLRFRGALAPELFAFGGWMSVSSLAVLVLNQGNNALMFGLLPVAAVGVYGTVAEMTIRLLVFPRAWVSVLFPSFSAQHAVEAGRLGELYARGVKGLLLFSFPVMLALFAFAGEGLTVWQDAAFAAEGTVAMRWLVAGMFLYGLSYVPFSLLQGVGHPSWCARTQALEIPFYLAGAWLLIRHFGMAGAGVAWFVRCAVETGVFFALARRVAPTADAPVARALGWALLGLLAMGLTALLDTLWTRAGVCVLACVPVAVAVWRWRGSS